MLMPTQEQRVRLLVHAAWDLLEDGNSDSIVIQNLVNEGAPAKIAQEAVRIARKGQSKSQYVVRRQRLLAELNTAVTSDDYEGIRNVLLEALDDERTLHKLYSALSALLVSDVHAQGTAAAIGLSFLIGLGDWPLIQALSHKNEWVRYRAAFALGKMGKHARHAIPALQEAMRDADEWVRDAATQAVAAIEKDR
jgi:HEAT repeat protein